jgi:anti-anti-sigma regulatory factor
MADKKKGTIGFDPLAWMKGGSAPVETTREPKVDGRAPEKTVCNVQPAAQENKPAATASMGTIALGDSLTIEQVGALYADLAGRLGEMHLVLDASSLTRVDTAGLQLLTAFVRAAGGRGARVEWCAPQMALRECARRIGLEGALRLP